MPTPRWHRPRQRCPLGARSGFLYREVRCDCKVRHKV